MDNLDMNINNYNLTELLNLFNLEYNFSIDDLKREKKRVLMTHPDKSNLPKEYFLFFSSAYKVILSIYEFRNKSLKSAPLQKPSYIIEKEEEEKELLMDKIKSQPNFNKVFNELFEKHNIKGKDEECGYGDWLKSNEDIDLRSTTMATMNQTFETKKKEIQAIIPIRELEEMNITFGSNLTDEKPEYYSSDLFSSLKYEDVKKAHIESVIPVTQEDYLQRPKFKNVDELLRDQNYNNTKPLSLDQSKAYLNNINNMQSKNDVNRAFNLAKQDENIKKANKDFMSNFLKLTNI
jgi:hypothetical protein